ncbi:MAG: flagellar FlbD family protein [Candidatus Erginobacter occultus]|nr:flagellar FlbD family protein [Candidatus Erginobacter occultus]
MIKLTRLNGQELVINAEMIERMEAKPDTIITLTTGEQYIVQDSVDQIIAKVTHYKQEINLPQKNQP